MKDIKLKLHFGSLVFGFLKLNFFRQRQFHSGLRSERVKKYKKFNYLFLDFNMCKRNLAVEIFYICTFERKCRGECYRMGPQRLRIIQIIHQLSNTCNSFPAGSDNFCILRFIF